MQYAPLRPQTRRERKRRYKPYITNTILSSIKKKQKLFKMVLNNPSNENWLAFSVKVKSITQLNELPDRSTDCLNDECLKLIFKCF